MSDNKENKRRQERVTDILLDVTPVDFAMPGQNALADVAAGLDAMAEGVRPDPEAFERALDGVSVPGGGELDAETTVRPDGVDATEAEEIGLVESAHPADEFDDAVNDLAATIASRGPLALEFAKTAVKAGSRTDLEAGIEYEAELFAQISATRDADEGIDAFLEDREPEFEGR